MDERILLKLGIQHIGPEIITVPPVSPSVVDLYQGNSSREFIWDLHHGVSSQRISKVAKVDKLLYQAGTIKRQLV